MGKKNNKKKKKKKKKFDPLNQPPTTEEDMDISGFMDRILEHSGGFTSGDVMGLAPPWSEMSLAVFTEPSKDLMAIQDMHEKEVYMGRAIGDILRAARDAGGMNSYPCCPLPQSSVAFMSLPDCPTCLHKHTPGHDEAIHHSVEHHIQGLSSSVDVHVQCSLSHLANLARISSFVDNEMLVSEQRWNELWRALWPLLRRPYHEGSGQGHAFIVLNNIASNGRLLSLPWENFDDGRGERGERGESKSSKLLHYLLTHVLSADSINIGAPFKDDTLISIGGRDLEDPNDKSARILIHNTLRFFATILNLQAYYDAKYKPNPVLLVSVINTLDSSLLTLSMIVHGHIHSTKDGRLRHELARSYMEVLLGMATNGICVCGQSKTLVQAGFENVTSKGRDGNWTSRILHELLASDHMKLHELVLTVLSRSMGINEEKMKHIPTVYPIVAVCGGQGLPLVKKSLISPAESIRDAAMMTLLRIIECGIIESDDDVKISFFNDELYEAVEACRAKGLTPNNIRIFNRFDALRKEKGSGATTSSSTTSSSTTTSSNSSSSSGRTSKKNRRTLTEKEKEQIRTCQVACPKSVMRLVNTYMDKDFFTSRLPKAKNEITKIWNAKRKGLLAAWKSYDTEFRSTCIKHNLSLMYESVLHSTFDVHFLGAHYSSLFLALDDGLILFEMFAIMIEYGMGGVYYWTCMLSGEQKEFTDAGTIDMMQKNELFRRFMYQFRMKQYDDFDIPSKDLEKYTDFMCLVDEHCAYALARSIFKILQEGEDGKKILDDPAPTLNLKLHRGMCEACGKGTVRKCGGCKMSYFCTKECMKKCWGNGHKKVCKDRVKRAKKKKKKNKR